MYYLLQLRAGNGLDVVHVGAGEIGVTGAEEVPSELLGAGGDVFLGEDVIGGLLAFDALQLGFVDALGGQRFKMTVDSVNDGFDVLGLAAEEDLEEAPAPGGGIGGTLDAVGQLGVPSDSR